MPITEYVIPLGVNARKRHYHQTERGKVVHFAVQLEIFHNEKWLPVVRYDAAHGFTHIDRYKKDGTKTKRNWTWLGAMRSLSQKKTSKKTGKLMQDGIWRANRCLI